MISPISGAQAADFIHWMTRVLLPRRRYKMAKASNALKQLEQVQIRDKLDLQMTDCNLPSLHYFMPALPLTLLTMTSCLCVFCIV